MTAEAPVQGRADPLAAFLRMISSACEIGRKAPAGLAQAMQNTGIAIPLPDLLAKPRRPVNSLAPGIDDDCPRPDRSVANRAARRPDPPPSTAAIIRRIPVVHGQKNTNGWFWHHALMRRAIAERLFSGPALAIADLVTQATP